MRNLRDAKSEMPGDFSTVYINSWSLESVTAIAIERRLNLLSGTSKDERAKELIRNIRIFFEQSFEYDGKPSIWKYYETKGFKEYFKTYDIMTK